LGLLCWKHTFLFIFKSSSWAILMVWLLNTRPLWPRHKHGFQAWKTLSHTSHVSMVPATADFFTDRWSVACQPPDKVQANLEMFRCFEGDSVCPFLTVMNYQEEENVMWKTHSHQRLISNPRWSLPASNQLLIWSFCLSQEEN
jgi:hypothetical protein